MTPSYNILVVDDDPDILTILKDNLDLDGFAVRTAESGKRALDMVERETIHMVVLDLTLPDMDGLQVCRAIRASSAMPIILLTARDAVSDKVLGLESGADDYVVKPFDYLELAARIKARLRRRRHFGDLVEVVELDGLRLNPDARTVEVKGTTKSLTKKEYDLLFMLLANAGRALDRVTIKRELWPGEGLYKWSRAIDVHIQHLRAKIEENPDNPQRIVTVQGVGYMLNRSDRAVAG